LEGLQDIKYKLFSGIPEFLLENEKETKQALERVKLDLYYEKTSSNPDKQFFSNLLDQRIKLSKKLDSIHQFFELNFPKYADLKYRNKIINIADAQSGIDNNTQLLTYFLGENNLYTFNITNDDITFLKGDIANTLLEKTKTLKDDLVQRKNITATSKRLYLFLLSQQIDTTKINMVVVPDNVLNYIPFEILQSDNGKYLIEDFTISYSGSVQLYLELQNDFFQYEFENYWAGFSPKYKKEDRLSSISEEISIISDLVKGEKFIGAKSKKKIFLENNKNYSILHLAMHAEINNENPMLNKLIFTDGDLTSSEIYISNSRANLVILSACNTGFGKLEKGEGVMSMARAFHFSGIPSVIMSLWKVPDKETKKIMVLFYKHLKEGESKNEALKNAKLAYLASTEDEYLKHPYYWSGFVLNGNTNALQPKKQYGYYFFGGVLLIGLIIFGMKINKR
jgi:CHAT domain-containing protein